jgi:hypothetical protein
MVHLRCRDTMHASAMISKTLDYHSKLDDIRLGFVFDFPTTICDFYYSFSGNFSSLIVEVAQVCGHAMLVNCICMLAISLLRKISLLGNLFQRHVGKSSPSTRNPKCVGMKWKTTYSDEEMTNRLHIRLAAFQASHPQTTAGRSIHRWGIRQKSYRCCTVDMYRVFTIRSWESQHATLQGAGMLWLRPIPVNTVHIAEKEGGIFAPRYRLTRAAFGRLYDGVYMCITWFRSLLFTAQNHHFLSRSVTFCLYLGVHCSGILDHSHLCV